MGLGSKVKGLFNKVSNAVSNAADNPAFAAFANPLIYQDVAGAAFTGAAVRGQDPMAAGLAAPGSLARGGSAGEWMDLAAFNAALLGGAAGGAAFGAGSIGSSALGGQFILAPTAAGIGAAGAAAGATAGYTLAAQSDADYPTGDTGSGTAPPDINESNDPDLAAQFKRIRKGARMLGRAGTIKYKGAANLGSGQTLGDDLALQGS